ncbi:12-oxophytodienoate reductase 3 [Talaromyces islandicus]|uniref:12-oxophytodienoate reductase 3 n=1 Tax=Talaromyces islandicus TaxID=28573 RepID=A0A0U1LSY3_TALIS|nr:12-oxophytodienoate reductase 3 [Talaromyces islandicus]
MADLHLAKPITLRCGLMLPNRLVKTAIAESIAPRNMLIDEGFHRVYGPWAEGGWGMVLTGHVQVDSMYLGTHTDPAVNAAFSDDQIVEAWKAWAVVCNQHGTPTIMQLNHPGRQAPIGAGTSGVFAKNISASAVPMDIGSGLLARAVSKIVFGIPREMTIGDIGKLIRQFARAARLAYQSGFAGVELHASHGYLLAQFLSAATNRRNDVYGGTPANRARIVVEIIEAVRAEVPASFCVGIILTAVDGQSSPGEFQSFIEQAQLIRDAGVDFIEISGGTFETPSMFIGPEKSGNAYDWSNQEAFFLDFVQAIRPHLTGTVPLLLSGGFRSCHAMEAAVKRGDCDMVGLARPAVVNPLLPKSVVFNPELNKNGDTQLHATRTPAPWYIKLCGIAALNVHMDNAWYVGRLQTLAKTGR